MPEKVYIVIKPSHSKNYLIRTPLKIQTITVYPPQSTRKKKDGRVIMRGPLWKLLNIVGSIT